MTTINSIRIQNFKSIRDLVLEDCRRVNVFIGYPNVGKSNILEAMSLLTFISNENRPIGLKGLVRYERKAQLFNLFNLEQPIKLELNGEFELEIAYRDESVLNFFPIKRKGEKAKYNKAVTGLRIGDKELFETSTNDVADFVGNVTELNELNVRPFEFPESKVFNKKFSGLVLRTPFGDNLFEVISNNVNLQDEFQELLNSYGLKLIVDLDTYELKVLPPQEVSRRLAMLPVSMLAETLIRLIFFKAAIATNKNAVLLFEEPESHMFPPYISKLTTDIIYDDNKNQYFIATHSPFVLETFIEDLDTKDLSIFLVGLNEGETVVKRLEDQDLADVSSYGVDLFFNLESYLNNGSVDNA